LRLRGKLLTSDPLLERKKFTSFFRQIEIKIDETEYPQYKLATWKRETIDYDGVEFKREGNKEADIEIALYP
jgi:hypothetical protein